MTDIDFWLRLAQVLRLVWIAVVVFGMLLAGANTRHSFRRYYILRSRPASPSVLRDVAALHLTADGLILLVLLVAMGVAVLAAWFPVEVRPPFVTAVLVAGNIVTVGLLAGMSLASRWRIREIEKKILNRPIGDRSDRL